MIDGVERLVEHMAWADRRALSAVRDIGDDEALELLAHVAAAEAVWIEGLTTGSSDGMAIWPDLDVEACGALFRENARRYREHFAPLSDLDLAEPVAYRNSSGTPYRTPAGDIVRHVALHGEHHRGQIARRLREAGGEPVNTDFITWSRAGSAREGGACTD